MVERLVCCQLVAFLEREGLLPVYQSAYRKHHSKETAVLKIVSDALLAADHGYVTLLGLLDLSAALETVDHGILIDRLHTAFGVCWPVLSWINSFICARTQTAILNGTQSTRSVLDCGSPRGSVLGLVLFVLYTVEVTNIAQRHGIGAHSYANDMQFYCHSKAVSCTSSISRMTTCIEEISQWITSNRLKLNSDKMQFIWLGTRQQLAMIHCQTITLRGTSTHISTEVRCLGVVINSGLKFALHIRPLAGRCFYQLRQLRSIRRSLNTNATKTFVNAFITSRFDY